MARNNGRNNGHHGTTRFAQAVIGIVIRSEGSIRHGFHTDTPFCTFVQGRYIRRVHIIIRVLSQCRQPALVFEIRSESDTTRGRLLRISRAVSRGRNSEIWLRLTNYTVFLSKTWISNIVGPTPMTRRRG